MARRKDVAPIDDPSTVTITEAPTENGEQKPRKKKMGVFVPFNELGQLDAKRVRDPEGIEQARAALGSSAIASPGAVEGVAGLVTEEHVKFALGYYHYVPVNTIVPMVNKPLRENGKPEISQELAIACYKLNDEQIAALAPDGALALNQILDTLPQWLKDFLFSFGPASKFFGQLAFITAMQTKGMMDLYKQQNSSSATQPVAQEIVQ